ncbi:glycosyltransferase [Pseudomonas tructae]|uniref:Glycosyltransferase n=1 Tax=Pseudomonas tructae TaxID=2518644 RepID=A0A411MGR7_9PSED|nr:glycosyltransferase [Pseudomonas tructae]QBF25849.1 glycosyltransferase [Pseudomonas tructae]
MGEKALESAAFLDDVTVVLLGQNDPGYSGRAAHYYRARFHHQVTVTVPCQQASSALWKAQLLAALDQVETPFVVLALDSDFLLADALSAQAQALRAEPEYLMAQGYSLGYCPGNSEVAYYKFGAALGANAIAETARERIALHGEHALQAWRALVRVEGLKAVLADAPLGLAFEGWCVALSYGLLAQGAVKVLAQASLISEYRPSLSVQGAAQEQLNQAVRLIRQWDEQRGRVCADAQGFEVLNAFVRNSHEGREAPLLFTSRWSSVVIEPERSFEPRQFVEMPYYNAVLFGQLRALEFLLHAWPAGQVHKNALEGSWVRQQALLVVQPNDTQESLKARYLQAFGLGLFNPQVCQRLLTTLDSKDDQTLIQVLSLWLKQLEELPGSNVQPLLAATPSGKVLAAIAAATPDSAGRKRILTHLGKNRSPQLAFLVIDLDDSDIALQDTFDSLLASGLRDFKIVVFKAGQLPAVTTAKDTLHFIKVNPGNLVAHINQVVRQLACDWLMLLQAGDVLAEGGLLRLQVELAGADACHAICANEVQRDQDGRLLSIVRPGCNLDLLRSRPDLMSRHWLVRRDRVVALGGYSEHCAQALEFDLLLRLVEEQGVAGLAHLDEYLVIGQYDRETMADAALVTLKRHLGVLGYNSQVSESADGAFQIDYRHSQSPLVSILLPSGDDLAQLQACLASIVQRTRYPRYEVIVVSSGAAAESTAAGLGNLQLGGRVKLLTSAQPLEHVQMFNEAAAQAQGEYLVLLSSRSQVFSPSWIEALLNQALRPEVGVVGGQMHDEAGLITHAGYELLDTQQVRSAWLGASRDAVGSMLGLAQVRSVAAVSEDCLMVRKELLEHCAGLQVIAGTDIDLCLKAAEAGLMVICTPLAQLLNAGVPLLDQAQQQALAARWPLAFNVRARVDERHGVDVSRVVAPGEAVELQWLADLQ